MLAETGTMRAAQILGHFHGALNWKAKYSLGMQRFLRLGTETD